jgi:hypothetical protein
LKRASLQLLPFAKMRASGAFACHLPTPPIMRTFQLWPLVAACVAFIGILPATAQQAASNAAPPQLEILEEGEEPAVTIRPPEQKQNISEKRAAGGRVTEIRVESGNSTYYMQPDQTGGNQAGGLRAPQWEIFRFDLKRTDEAAKAADVPPPAPTNAPPAK